MLFNIFAFTKFQIRTKEFNEDILTTLTNLIVALPFLSATKNNEKKRRKKLDFNAQKVGESITHLHTLDLPGTALGCPQFLANPCQCDKFVQ